MTTLSSGFMNADGSSYAICRPVPSFCSGQPVFSAQREIAAESHDEDADENERDHRGVAVDKRKCPVTISDGEDSFEEVARAASDGDRGDKFRRADAG